MSAAGPRTRRTTSQTRIIDNLRLASRKGDRTALALALDEMRTLAFTPRYWIRYLTLIRHPLARIVDLLVIKQGDKIARQKGWSPTGRPGRADPRPPGPRRLRGRGEPRRRAPVRNRRRCFPDSRPEPSAGAPVRRRACRGCAGPPRRSPPARFPGRPKSVSLASTANATASFASGSRPTSASDRTGTGASVAPSAAMSVRFRAPPPETSTSATGSRTHRRIPAATDSATKRVRLAKRSRSRPR